MIMVRTGKKATASPMARRAKWQVACQSRVHSGLPACDRDRRPRVSPQVLRSGVRQAASGLGAGVPAAAGQDCTAAISSASGARACGPASE
jgi:hypothetical protein